MTPTTRNPGIRDRDPITGGRLCLGTTGPAGQSLDHAGAIAEPGRGDYASKVAAFAPAGVQIAEHMQIALLLATCRNLEASMADRP